MNLTKDIFAKETMNSEVPNIFSFFLKKCGAHQSCFGGLMTSALGFKARVNPLRSALCCLCTIDFRDSSLDSQHKSFYGLLFQHSCLKN